LHFSGEKFNQLAIDIVPAQPRVAMGGEHLEHALVQFKNRKIECAAPKIVNRNSRMILEFIQSVCQRCRRRFIDDSLNRPPGKFAGFFGRLPLRIVEIGRNGYHRPLDLLRHESLGIGLQFLQHFGRNIFRRISVRTG